MAGLSGRTYWQGACVEYVGRARSINIGNADDLRVALRYGSSVSAVGRPVGARWLGRIWLFGRSL